MEYDNYKLPSGYRENEVFSVDNSETEFWPGEPSKMELSWQVPAYKFAGQYAEKLRPKIILDVGCGPGIKLVTYLGTSAEKVVGFDQHSGISKAKSRYPDHTWIEGNLENQEDWEILSELQPDVVMSMDVIEHLSNPRKFLENIKHIMTKDTILFLSTPDRANMENASPLGPPANGRHVREWAADELQEFVSDVGFEVLAVNNLLPREYHYSVRELVRFLWRAITFKALPDKKQNLILVLKLQSTW